MKVILLSLCLLVLLHCAFSFPNQRQTRASLESVFRLLELQNRGKGNGDPTGGNKKDKPRSKDEDILKAVQDFLDVDCAADQSVTMKPLCDAINRLLPLVYPVVQSGVDPGCTVKGLGKRAECVVDKSSGLPSQEIEGIVKFKQKGDGPVGVSIRLDGFDNTDGLSVHGFHVHENGELGNMCNDAGSHFNPENVQHGGSDAAVRHVGDLGNINEDAEGRVVKTTFTDDVISLTGPQSIVGKSIVVHETFDDLGLGGHDDSLTTGHAGGRLGCCVIKLVENSTEDDIPMPSVDELETCVGVEALAAETIIETAESLEGRSKDVLLLDVLRILYRVVDTTRELKEMMGLDAIP